MIKKIILIRYQDYNSKDYNIIIKVPLKTTIDG